MIRFRLLAASLAISASACSIWFLAAGPLDGLDAGTDAQPDAAELTDGATDAGVPDTSSPMFTQIASGVGAITVYDDQLYANVSGELWTCADAACSKLQPLVHVDASTPFPQGLAADDAGVFWVAANGIWAASLDGSGATFVIEDDNNPQVLAVDGPRVSWTTQIDGGTPVIRSCATARKGGVACKFTKAVGADGGQGIGTGAGGAVELVDAASSIDNSQLAAGPGFVVWVAKGGNQVMTYTPVDGGPWTPFNSTNDKLFASLGSNATLVANDGPTVVYSFFNKTGNNTYVLERSQFPANVQGVYLTNGAIQPKQDYCIGASSGIAAYCPTSNQIVLVDEYDGGGPGALTLAPAQAPLDGVAVTSGLVFVLDSEHALYAYPRN